MKQGDIVEIFVDETEQRYYSEKRFSIGMFELIEKLNMGNATLEYWKAKNITTGKIGKYLIKIDSYEKDSIT